MPFDLNVTDAGAFLNYTPYCIRKFVKEGRLKAFRYKPGAALRFRRQDLVRFMNVTDGKYPQKLRGAVKKLSEEARARRLAEKAKKPYSKVKS